MSSKNENERVQKVVFVRHGIALHNLPGSNLSDPKLFDPPLIYQGKQQALHTGHRLQEWWRASSQKEVELVVTSPLTRCIQTATLAFLPGDIYTTTTTTTNNGSKKEPSFFCTELCREAFGMHYPDKRRQRSLLMEYWPMLGFDPGMREMDEAWKKDARETISELHVRISFFFTWLMGRSEKSIVVVTHGVWIEQCIRLHCPKALDDGKRRVYNCDMIAMDCISQNGEFLRIENAHLI